jgi:hypothetical protein
VLLLSQQVEHVAPIRLGEDRKQGVSHAGNMLLQLYVCQGI